MENIDPPVGAAPGGLSTTRVATLTNSHPSVSSLLVSLYQDPAEQPGWQRQDRHHCHRHPGTDERGADHLHPQVSPDIWWFVSNLIRISFLQKSGFDSVWVDLAQCGWI